MSSNNYSAPDTEQAIIQEIIRENNQRRRQDTSISQLILYNQILQNQARADPNDPARNILDYNIQMGRNRQYFINLIEDFVEAYLNPPLENQNNPVEFEDEKKLKVFGKYFLNLNEKNISKAIVFAKEIIGLVGFEHARSEQFDREAFEEELLNICDYGPEVELFGDNGYIQRYRERMTDAVRRDL